MGALFEKYRARALALGILALLLLTGWFAVVQPIASAFTDQSDDVAQSVQLISSYQAEIASRQSLEAQLAQIQTQESAAAGLIDGKNAALAAATMQSLVKTLIESEHGQVRSAQNLPSSAFNGFDRVAIQYDVSLPMNRLENTTYRLETQLPYLFLDDVDIRMSDAWQSEGSASDPSPLQISWTVRGYRGAQAP